MRTHQNSISKRSMDMESLKYQRLLLSLPHLTPSEGIPLHVFSRIAESQKKTARIRFVSFTLISFASFTSLIPLTSFALGELSESEFYQYLSIIFTDRDILFFAWKDSILGLIESIPLTGITVSLVAVFIFLYSVNLAAKSTHGSLLTLKNI
jgi:hypothetical protein